MAERRSRHPRDAVSLVMGLVLCAIATLFLVEDIGDGNVDLRWVAPAVLIGIGVIGLSASARRR
jgi:hypothetical protein